ncbi:MAG: hypothetical protein E6R04_08090 [Spirochaetes bacterium]|nr:MAG: hypothetical protein E6R04_08090 [Spirochaetota bacterium]
MSKISISVNKVRAQVEKDLKESLNNSRMQKIGEFVIEKIRIRTRLGYGASGHLRPREKLKPLAESSKDIRKGFKKAGELSEFTSPGRSNLTFTGQMLDSLTVRVISMGKIIIDVTGIRKPTKKKDDLRTNKEVAQKVTDEGRPFMYLTDKDYKAVINFVRDGFKSILKKRLTR